MTEERFNGNLVVKVEGNIQIIPCTPSRRDTFRRDTRCSYVFPHPMRSQEELAELNRVYDIMTNKKPETGIGMIVLDVKLSKNGESPVLVADESMRKYNWGRIAVPSDNGQVLLRKEDVDVRKVNFEYPVMTDFDKVMKGDGQFKGYQFA